MFLDHAICKLTLEVLMDPKNEELKNVINLRMGGFHAFCIFIEVIRKWFAATNLQDLCIEADLVGTASAKKIMKCKQYNTAVQSLKVVYEALQQIKLEAFDKRLLSTHHSNADLLRFLESEELKNLIEEPSLTNLNALTELDTTLFERFQQFEELLSDFRPMAKSWNSFVEMVQILTDFIKSTRNGDWHTHRKAFERMLKRYFAYDWTNYSRILGHRAKTSFYPSRHL